MDVALCRHHKENGLYSIIHTVSSRRCARVLRTLGLLSHCADGTTRLCNSSMKSSSPNVMPLQGSDDDDDDDDERVEEDLVPDTGNSLTGVIWEHDGDTSDV